jgi:hypothetical protein
MTGEPETQDGYVAYEQGQRPVLYEPHEAEALALSLLGAATKARASRLADSTETADDGREEPSKRRIV